MNQDRLTDEQKARLEQLKPFRVLVRLHRETRDVEAYTEQSFSMTWARDRALIYWSGTANSMIGSFTMNAIEDAQAHKSPFDRAQFVFDPFSDDCPIDIDWFAWMNATRKYEVRNAPFVIKPHGQWQMRALMAEADSAHWDKVSKELSAHADKLNEKLRQIHCIIDPPPPEEQNDD